MERHPAQFRPCAKVPYVPALQLREELCRDTITDAVIMLYVMRSVCVTSMVACTYPTSHAEDEARYVRIAHPGSEEFAVVWRRNLLPHGAMYRSPIGGLEPSASR